jgi:hypothetical protein
LVEQEPYYNLPPTDLYKNILNPRFEFHMPEQLSLEVVDLIRRLLAWQPMRRFGCLTDGAADVKSHAFFSTCSIDWGALHAGKLVPPRKPDLASEHDTTHFDDPTEDDAFLETDEYQPEPGAFDVDF